MNSKRRALLVGIDKYEHLGSLTSAGRDAEALKPLLSRHEDGTLNYECQVWKGKTPYGDRITRPVLRQALEELFANFRGDVLFYFAGHGSIGGLGGYLVTQDGHPGDWGLPMDEVLRMAMHSEASDILIILDCCNAGDLANFHLLPQHQGARGLATLREDMTVLGAAMAQQQAMEGSEHGRFTEALLSALEGSAADPMGWVTASSIYASIERQFGAWPQQPVFKTHATRATIVRRVNPVIELEKLRRLPVLFEKRDEPIQLDPGHEGLTKTGKKVATPNNEKLETMQLLREYLAAGLIKPTTPKKHLYHVALESLKVELTARGKEFWKLVRSEKI